MKLGKTIRKGPKSTDHILILAHGAGAPMDSDWMNDLCEALARANVQTLRFEFPYMQARRDTGKKSPPNRMPLLHQCWKLALEKAAPHKRIFVGGKSMGGRAISLIADDQNVEGLICFGFPFHAPGKLPKDRIQHLEDLKTPTLILQGDRDPMGSKDEVSSYKLSPSIKVSYLDDGDHSFKPRVKSGHTLEGHIQSAATQTAEFIFSKT
ncbi:MAG: alpha/beta hydrolase [Bdellovibrionaceae bacterium]|nr:alpha/beta hydrolase [Pseudobdellovibrionaceae bacterium]|tara:strand:+ start:65277 stop:65903 length:627 start_codon:yes stop_codon:yes gene_type:complete